jgi:uncharacterized membrane protein YgcG
MAIAILSFVVAVAVFLNVVATWKAHRYTGLTRAQKIAQTILAWIIPFFGAIAVIVVSTDPAERQKRAAAVDPGADGLIGGAYFGGDGGHHGGHGGDSGHGGDGGGQGGDGGGGH